MSINALPKTPTLTPISQRLAEDIFQFLAYQKNFDREDVLETIKYYGQKLIIATSINCFNRAAQDQEITESIYQEIDSTIYQLSIKLSQNIQAQKLIKKNQMSLAKRIQKYGRKRRLYSINHIKNRKRAGAIFKRYRRFLLSSCFFKGYKKQNRCSTGSFIFNTKSVA